MISVICIPQSVEQSQMDPIPNEYEGSLDIMYFGGVSSTMDHHGLLFVFYSGFHHLI